VVDCCSRYSGGRGVKDSSKRPKRDGTNHPCWVVRRPTKDRRLGKRERGRPICWVARTKRNEANDRTGDHLGTTAPDEGIAGREARPPKEKTGRGREKKGHSGVNLEKNDSERAIGERALLHEKLPGGGLEYGAVREKRTRGKGNLFTLRADFVPRS